MPALRNDSWSEAHVLAPTDRFFLKEEFKNGKVCIVYCQEREEELPRIGITYLPPMLRDKATEENRLPI